MLKSALILLTGFGLVFGVATARAEPAAPAATIPAAYAVSVLDAEAAVSRALVEKGAGDRVKADITGLHGANLYEGSKPVEIKVTGLTVDKTAARWSASLIIASGTEVLTALPATGRFQEMAELPVLRRQLRSGDIIAEADIDLMQFPLARIRGDAVTDAAQLVGQSPRTVVSPGRPLRASELSAPSVMKKNTLITLRYRNKSMEITTSGLALRAGAAGDMVEVRNINSKQIVRATVIDANTAEVQPNALVTAQR